MVNKKFEEKLIWGIVGVLLIFIFGYLFFPNAFSLTSFATQNGLVGLTVLDPVISISIVSPENTTYNFAAGDFYNLSLNVTSDFAVESWWYNIYDERHDNYTFENVVFTPNVTINVSRWNNRIEVYANHTVGTIANENVTFYIVVPNSAPSLGDIDEHIYVCENNSLSNYFNATDADENTLISVDISPKDPFYVSPSTFTGGQTFIESYIISEDFTKSDVGSHLETVSVSDQEYIDTQLVNITVVEINNLPLFSELGAQTVWINGTFYKALDLTDTESGNRTSGNFTYVLTFIDGTRFFDIDNEGVMNFTSNESVIGSYNVSVCVTDKPLDSVPENISLCGQDGLAQKTCKNMSLAVTNQNRAPTIVSYYPASIGSIAGTSGLYFNASVIDPDGNIPTAYWYVDNSLKELDVGSNVDTFSYTFGCGVSGSHTVELVVSDGELNDSVMWPVTVANIECPAAVSGGGGGGGGSIGARCQVNWVCDDWQVCQNNQISLDIGIISGVDFRKAQRSCDAQGLIEDICGVQIRDCIDLNSCNVTIGMPDEFQACYFIEEPSCFDGVKNCHDEGCELLVDCGGPCTPCATCSDGVKNQGEQGVDCGGPCPWKCVEKIPFVRKYFLQLALIILATVVTFATFRVRKIINLRKELAKKPRRRDEE